MTTKRTKTKTQEPASQQVSEDQIWEASLAQALTESVNAGYITSTLATGILAVVKSSVAAEKKSRGI